MAAYVDLEVPRLSNALRQLGDIPPDRVIWLGRAATEEDMLQFVDGEPRRLVELIDGFLVEKAVGYAGSIAAGLVAMHLMNFVRPRRLGLVAGPNAPMRVAAGRVRMADVSFTAWATLPTADAHLQSIASFVGDLMVEILTPFDTPREIENKRRDYFAAGTRLVWVIDPAARTSAVYTDPDAHTVLTETDSLTGGDVLPEFALPLADLFGAPQLNPRTLAPAPGG